VYLDVHIGMWAEFTGATDKFQAGEWQGRFLKALSAKVAYGLFPPMAQLLHASQTIATCLLHWLFLCMVGFLLTSDLKPLGPCSPATWAFPSQAATCGPPL
jgi:hypothetical protein